jgi:hypothetical protein
MKIMSRDPAASERARKAEQRQDEKSGLGGLISVKLGGGDHSKKKTGGFKKGGFKSAFGVQKDEEEEQHERKVEEDRVEVSRVTGGEVDDEEEDWGYQVYDPRKPTGCDGRCGAIINAAG